MSKQIQIPINEFDYFTSDGTYAGVKFRYRLKEDSTDNSTSQWSELKELIFKDSENSNITLSEANGYEAPTDISRTSLVNPLTFDTFGSGTPRMMPSQIDQIISQNNLTNGFMPTPKNDLYRLSWITPEKFNIGKFDIFQSWRGVAYVHPIANITAPTLTGGAYVGTLSLAGTGATIRSQTLKSYYDWYASNVSTDLPLYASEGSRVPGNTLAITGYSSTSSFAVKSASTWVGSGNFLNISRIDAFTEPEYLATTDTNRIEFAKKMQSNKVSATLIAGSSVVRVNETIATSGIVPGMKVVKISGDGRFSTDGNSIISQIDYQNNLLFISYDEIDGGATNSLAGPFTISNVQNPTGGVWIATINSSSLGTNFEVGYMIGATAGTGTLGNGIVRVTSTNNSTQINIQSNVAITAGTITNLTTIYRKNHGISGYIEFVGDANDSFSISYGSDTNIEHHWMTQFLCQSIIAAPTKDKYWSNLYTLLSLSETQVVYNSGLGKITSSTGTAPFTATITGLSMPYSSSTANTGFRIYANPTTGGGSIGTGEVKVARYLSGNSINIVSTAAITDGFVYGIRL